ncbi:Excinuclease ABC subunit A [Bacteroidales bacterium Barb6]|nr:Excinuclease ABC subunit A [Bacteroidales bacterium Barb6]
MNDIVREAAAFPEGTRLIVCAPIVLPKGRTMRQQLEIFQKEGYARIALNEAVYRISEALEDKSLIDTQGIELLIDRLTVSSDKTFRSRLADSAETAFFEGQGVCTVRLFPEGESTVVKEYTKTFEADGILFEEPSDMMFNFNNPFGACPTCEGFGKVIGIDEDLVVPNKNLSLYEGAVLCWKGDAMSEWQKKFIAGSGKYKFPIHTPYRQLGFAEKELLWHGRGSLHGIDAFFRFVEENQYKIQYRVLLARYRGKTVCPSCKGARLRPEALYVQVGGKDISSLVRLPITEAKTFFDRLTLDETDAAIAQRLLTEIHARLNFLLDVGLGYLTLDRLSSTLSGGESQRINLATSLGSSLVGSLYILDEPSIGLHSRDTQLLIKVLRQLQELGNTVVVVEHDEEIIRAADYMIDIGPDAGRLGGEVVFQGELSRLDTEANSHTVRYLTGQDTIAIPPVRRRWNNYIKVEEARKNNLKGISVKFPLNVMTVVTGVSGSGKSSLVRDIFYEGMRRVLDDAPPSGIEASGISGDTHLVNAIEFVDQHSIGKSSRSNPVTYIGAYDEIRRLFAERPLSKQMGYTSAHFSFNKEGGRCEECKGDGRITVEMQFMADITLECDVCHGKRFKPEILEAEYDGANICDVLDMTVNQAIEFFSKDTGAQEQKIIKRLRPLQDVGLGYIKLGQSSSTLSGGENQRVKLACYLGMERQQPTLFVFDEPTTGLHFHDIKTLLKAFNALIDRGHTLVVIEHNMDVIKCADHIIDLGPEGGKDGGMLICEGTPEEVAACKKSYTGQFLKGKLKGSTE